MLFREKLTELRQAAGFTQERLAEASGVPLSSLRKYEQGARVHVTLGIAVRLAKALGASCEAFAACEDVAREDAPPLAPVEPSRPRPAGKRPRK